MKETGTHISPHVSARRAAVSRLGEEPTTERRADTQRRLLDAGRQVITQYGVGGASVGLITKAAGFSRGAFYSNFADMDHFVTQLAGHEWESVLASIGQTLNAAIPGTLAEGEHGTPHNTLADTIAAELLASTEPLLGPGAASAGNGVQRDWADDNRADDHLAQVDVLSRALLSTIPRDREFHLLWSSLANFMVRDPEGSSQLRQAFFEFRTGMAQYVVAALGQLGLRTRVSPLDLVDIMIGIGTRSAQTKLANASTDKEDGELLDRVVPDLLRVLIVSASDD